MSASDSLGTAAVAAWREFAWVTLAAASFCVLISLALGRDLNWDYYNYHGYAALSALQSRLGQDFWPAGVQGYLNPLPFLPFVLMQQAAWPSALVASVLAIIQSLSLVALYGLSRHLAAGSTCPRLAASLATALGAASAVYVSQIGSTFVDATTSPLLMVAVWLLVAGRSKRALLFAAALAGAAMGLKWTNAPFAMGLLLAAGLRLRLTESSWAAMAKASAQVSLSLAAGFVLSYGWWGWRLYQEFGSPLFPLFNGIFQSPDATIESATYLRYVPQDWTQLFSLPLRMVEHKAWVYTEVMAPDIRPLLLLVLGPLAWVASWSRRESRGDAAPTTDTVALFAFVALSTGLWLVTSTNGRYAAPLLLLLGPLLFMAIRSLLAERRALQLCLLVLVVQVTHAGIAGNPRWSAAPWSDTWLPHAPLPAEVTQTPQLFVVVGRQSESYLAALVHPESAFTNPIGLVSLRNDGPGWSRFTALRDKHVGRTQVVFLLSPEDTQADIAHRALARNRLIDRLGLTMDTTRCRRLVFNAQDDPHQLSKGTQLGNIHGRHLASCPAALLEGPDAQLARARAKATAIMDAYEAQCPSMLSPRQTQIEGNGGLWERYYGKFDLFLTVDLVNGLVHMRQERQVDPVVVGQVQTWRTDAERFACQLPHKGERGITTMASNR